MLTPRQKRQLKSMAMTLTTAYQIGKNEITENSLIMLDKALTANELIKINLLKTVETNIMEIALDLASNLHAEVVQVIGRVIVLYRKNNKKPVIILEK